MCIIEPRQTSPGETCELKLYTCHFPSRRHRSVAEPYCRGMYLSRDDPGGLKASFYYYLPRQLSGVVKENHQTSDSAWIIWTTAE